MKAFLLRNHTKKVQYLYRICVNFILPYGLIKSITIMRFSFTSRSLYFLFFLFIFQNIVGQTSEQEAQEMLTLVNEIRTARGIPLLSLNTELSKAAYDHSNDMARNNYFSHTGLNGSTFSQRINAAGYNGSPRGENIAAGNATVINTFNQWLNSPGHLNNMLNSNSNEMGIGHAIDNGSTYTHYWTQVFGKSSQVLSSGDDASIQKIRIYPNPVKDVLHMDLQNTIEGFLNIKLVSATGQIVFQQIKNQDVVDLKLNISHLPTGVYFLYFQNTNIYKVLKL